MGIGAMASLLIEIDHHVNDATITVVPIRPMNVYVVSDSTLKSRKKWRAGYQGPELAMTEQLRILGVSDIEYSIIPRLESLHIAETCASFTMKEQEHVKQRSLLREHGCHAANDPKFEQSPSFDARVAGDAVQIVVWSGNEVFNKKTRFASRPSPTTRSTLRVL